MTLIAAFQVQGTPFLLSDVLVTAYSNVARVQHHTIATSLYADQVLTPEDGWSIKKPVQKSYIINDDLCVAVAGDFLGCSTAVIQLAGRFSTNKPTNIGEIYAFFRQQLDTKGYDVTVIGWVVIQRNATTFRYASRDEKAYDTRDLFAAGSGAARFREQWDTGFKGRYALPPDRSMFVNDPQLPAKMCVLAEVAELLIKEMLNTKPHPLRELFGGGFQLVYYDGTRFRFIDKYTLVYSSGHLNQDGTHEVRFGGPFVFFNNSAGYFIVRRFDIANQPPLYETKVTLPIAGKIIDPIVSFLVDSTLSDDVLAEEQIETDIYLFPMLWHFPDGRHPRVWPLVIPRTPGDLFTLRLTHVKDGIQLEFGPNAKGNFDRLAAEVRSGR
jgi:hypothetical protein